MEGTKRGFDFELLKEVSSNVNVPIIASGGFGIPEHMIKAFKYCDVDAIAIADALHYKKYQIKDLRKIAKKEKLKVRSF